MKQKALTHLLHGPADLDYVEHFQSLADVNLEIRRYGPSTERLLRKAILEMDVGNFQSGLEAAKDAVVLDGQCQEAHYQVGVSYVMLAFVKAGAVPTGPGNQSTPSETAMELLNQAGDAFGRALRITPHDEESKEDLTIVSELLAEVKEENALLQVLREAARA